jgi:hypothetical protein
MFALNVNISTELGTMLIVDPFSDKFAIAVAAAAFGPNPI